MDLYSAGEEHRPVEQRIYDAQAGDSSWTAPLYRLSNVLIEGVTFTYSPFWTRPSHLV